MISSGTTANFLATNPTNSMAVAPVALFSFAAANPDNINHFRWYTPKQETDPSVQAVAHHG